MQSLAEASASDDEWVAAVCGCITISTELLDMPPRRHDAEERSAGLKQEVSMEKRFTVHTKITICPLCSVCESKDCIGT